MRAMTMRAMRLAAAKFPLVSSVLVLAACSDDPCDGVAGRCIALHVESTSVDRIDQLELDVLYGDRHGTATTSDGVVDLPLTTAIELPGDGTLLVGIVAAGKLAGVVLGAGADELEVGAAAHVTMSITLAPTGDCTAGSFYCGGDMIAGDPQTLYICNGGGVPFARGRCLHGCTVVPGGNDYCEGGDLPCIEPGFYCGGDKLDGDPQSRYRCSGGAGIERMVCPNGCVVAPPGDDDYCR
jgi:hypothetical protein